jgi:hypothetical protein
VNPLPPLSFLAKFSRGLRRREQVRVNRLQVQLASLAHQYVFLQIGQSVLR